MNSRTMAVRMIEGLRKQAEEDGKRGFGERSLHGAAKGLGVGSLIGLLGGGIAGGLQGNKYYNTLNRMPFGPKLTLKDRLKYILDGALGGGTSGAVVGGGAGGAVGAALGGLLGSRKQNESGTF